LRDVAWGPSVETGANVPSYSDVGASGVLRRVTGCRRPAGSGEKLVILLDIWGVVAGQ
jgi:hypothetical protein